MDAELCNLCGETLEPEHACVRIEFNAILSHAFAGCDLTDIDKDTWDLALNGCVNYAFDLMATIEKSAAVPPRTEVVAEMREVLARYDMAAQKFVNKVNNGQARSKETYADMLECLERSQKLKLLHGDWQLSKDGE